MATAHNRRKPVAAYALMACLLFQGVSGMAGGLGLLMDPSGETLRIPLNWLEGSPFQDYTIPGLVLLVVLGIFPIAVLYGLWNGEGWGWTGAVLVGLALIVWLVVEIIVIGYQPDPPLQLIYGILGAAILVLTALSRVREFYGVSVS
jgi:hypothetical protein